jgi:hypothetical protein
MQSDVSLLPVIAADIGISSTNPRLTYSVASFDLLSDDFDSFAGSASFNAFQSAVSSGDFVTVNPNAAIGVTVSVNPTEFAVTPPLGLMIVSQDNKSLSTARRVTPSHGPRLTVGNSSVG